MAKVQRHTLSAFLLVLLCSLVLLSAAAPAAPQAQSQPQQHPQHVYAPAGTEQRHNTTMAPGGMTNTTHAAGAGGNTTAVPAHNATTTVNTTARRLLRDGKTKGASLSLSNYYWSSC